MLFIATWILLLAGCKKNKPDSGGEAVQAFLPQKITITGAIEPDLNGTIQFTYNANRQITGIRRLAKSGNETLNWTYTYEGKKLTKVRYTLDNALSSPSHLQTDYTYEYTGDTPVKVTVVFSNNLGETETMVENVTKPATDRFYIWTTNYTYTQSGDWAAGSGSLIEGSGITVTYSDKEGVFAHVEKSPVQHFFLDRKNITYLLLFAKKELATLQVNMPSSTGWAGDYNSIAVERNGQNQILKYTIKNNTKTYAQFDMEYMTIQL